MPRAVAARAPRGEARRARTARNRTRDRRAPAEFVALVPRGQVARSPGGSIGPSRRACIIDQPRELGDAVSVNSNDWSRREFLGTSAAAGASLAAQNIGPLSKPLLVRPAPGPASDRVRFGMVGIGMQGNGLLSESIQLPGVECAAACDLYDGRHTLAREIVRPDLPVTRRYQDLLDNKDIDCIVAAVPDP